MCTTYILQSLSNGKFYIGSTRNLQQRFSQHQRNQTKSLKNKGPFKVVYQKDFDTYTEARKMEIEIKNYKGGKKFKKLIG